MCPDGSPDAINVNAMAFLPRVLLPTREEEESSGSGVIEVGRGCTSRSHPLHHVSPSLSTKGVDALAGIPKKRYHMSETSRCGDASLS